MTRIHKTLTIPLIVLIIGASQACAKRQNQSSEQTGWQLLDRELDSIPGISLEKAYRATIRPNGQEIVVALIDSPIDLDHPDLKQQFWVNGDEIPNNQIDDDGNGYVDDVHGWNYLGYGDGKTLQFANYDYVRAIRRLSPKFEGLDSTLIKDTDSIENRVYRRALELMEADIPDIEGELGYYTEELVNFRESTKLFEAAYDPITGLFNESTLDSMEPKTEREKELLPIAKDFAYYGWYPSLMENFKNQGEMRKIVCANLDTIPRALIGDDIYDLSDIRGNPIVDAPEGWITHATQVAGVIAATRDNGTGIKGVSNAIRIMPLVIFPERGHETDKDLANAIRYAVDNGAKIINYSHGKYFVERPDFIWDAIKYAEEHGVLVVTAAGNVPKDIDVKENSPYPIDNPGNGPELATNLLRVGASGKSFKWPKTSWGSYGRKNVDMFAPGQRMLTTNSGDRPYFTVGGSSLSCALTSGVAALLWSQYPDLDHRQVKTILMISGNRVHRKVDIGDDVFVNFEELSATGRILNAHTALLLGREASSLD
ncbi:S8 family serine peptidase [Flagellimonas pacifica]|uniref:Subtilase family protein n=1 Tax=Flagellimonas pacifica TaxID=1247520 RepID=A0A285MS65_9FLAO|nr:S8 family serine peptidase [Allomuricauda parva]SNY99523.1 Subtilase family protein [Allomuricauda parva]